MKSIILILSIIFLGSLAGECYSTTTVDSLTLSEATLREDYGKQLEEIAEKNRTEFDEKFAPQIEALTTIDIQDLIPRTSLMRADISRRKTPSVFSLGRIFSPWLSPLSYLHRGGDTQVEFGAGVSYLITNHLAISFSGHKDWNSSEKELRISMKVF